MLLRLKLLTWPTIFLRILEHGDGWFDKLRELLRAHEDQKEISCLLEALNDIFIIGSKANKWTFSLTTQHCTVTTSRPRSITEQPDLIGDILDRQPIINLILYDENLGNSSCAPIGKLLSQYNVIAQLNVGKNRISARGVRALAEGLADSQSLEKLNLRLNPIENSGIVILVESLKRNKSVRELNLCHIDLQVKVAFHSIPCIPDPIY